MAWIDRRMCIVCREMKDIVSSAGRINDTCGDCKTRQAKEARDKHFAELDAMPLEERLRRVEEWIYDYHPVHVPPPRF